MLGTKVSTYGFMIILLISLLIYFFFTFIKKEIKFKHSVCLFMIFTFIACILVLPQTPAINRTFVDKQMYEDYNSNVDGTLEDNNKKANDLSEKLKKEYASKKPSSKDENIEDIDIKDILKELSKEEKDKYLIEYIETNYQNYNLNYHFVFNSYPYTYDAEFWYNVMNLSIEERTNFRTIEKMMLERVKEVNNNKFDDYLGITFTRMGNIFDLERDYLSHYYTLGIVGLLLLIIPYLIITLICIIKILATFKESCNLKNVFYLLGIGITLFAAYYTGNVMDGLVVTLTLGFFIGQLINGTFNLKNKINIDKKAYK